MLEIGQLVGEGAHTACQVHGQRSDGRVRTAISNHPTVHPCNSPVFLHPHCVIHHHVVPPSAGHKLFFHVVNKLDRLARHLGKQHGTEISCQGIVLCPPKAAANKRLYHPHLAQGHPKTSSQVPVDKVGALLGRPDGDP